MRLFQAISLSGYRWEYIVNAFGTSEGVRKSWDTRGRGKTGQELYSRSPQRIAHQKWAMHPTEGLIFDPEGDDSARTHVEWFEKMGLPTAGPRYDRINKGYLSIDEAHKLITYAGEEGNTVPEVEERVKEAFPGIEKTHKFSDYSNQFVDTYHDLWGHPL